MNSLLESLAPFIKTGRRILAHNVIISFVIMMSVLIACFFLISQILLLPDDSDYRTAQKQKTINTAFDPATVKKIKQLRESSDSDTIMIPSSRYNPFQ